MKTIINQIGELTKQEAKELKYIGERALHCVETDTHLNEIGKENIDKVIEQIIVECKDIVREIDSIELEHSPQEIRTFFFDNEGYMETDEVILDYFLKNKNDNYNR